MLLGDPGVYVGDFCENVGEYNDLGVLLCDLLFSCEEHREYFWLPGGHVWVSKDSDV